MLKVHNRVHLMKDCGENLTDKMIVEKVMRTLTSHFDHVIVVVQESNNLETLKLEHLVGSLKACEIRIIERKRVQDSIQAWKKKQVGSNKGKGKGDKTQGKKSWSNPQEHEFDDRASESSTRGGGYSYSKSNARTGVQCTICKNWGHFAKICWYRKDKGSTNGKEEGSNLAQHDSNDLDDMVVMAAVADDHVDSKIWFLDTSCSNHMTGRKIWLAYFDKSKKRKVKLADNSSIEAKGTGNIVLQRSKGGKSMIKDVLYVPRMKCNLLSVGQLVKKGFSEIMKDGAFELFDTQNSLVLKSPMSKNRTFKTMISSTCAIDKPLLSTGFDEETVEVEIETVVDIPDTFNVKEGGFSEETNVEVETVADILDTDDVEEGVAKAVEDIDEETNEVEVEDIVKFETITVIPDKVYVKEGVDSTSQRPQQNEVEVEIVVEIPDTVDVEELQAIGRNNTWKLVKLSAHSKAINVKLVFKLKHNPDGSIARYKSRSVARGLESVRLVVALACKRGWSTFHLDVK